MALIKCPECGREISDKAQFCPSCGFPLNVENPRPSPESRPKIKSDERSVDATADEVTIETEEVNATVDEAVAKTEVVEVAAEEASEKAETEVAATSEEARKPLPPFLKFVIIMAVIGGVIGIVRQSLETSNRRAAAEISKEVQDYLTGQSSSSSSIGVQQVRYDELTVKIPANWTYEKDDLMDKTFHQLRIQSPDGNDLSILSWGKNLLPPKEAAQAIYDRGGDDYEAFSASSITKGSFCGQEAYTFDFSIDDNGTPLYSRGYYFMMDGWLVTVNNFSNYRSHLADRFGFIEETLTID